MDKKEKDIRSAAADLLLGRGVRFKISGAPFWWKVKGWNKITIKALKLGTIMEFSKIMIDEELVDAEYEQCIEKMESVCRVVAIAMLNDKKWIEKRAEEITERFLWKFPAETMINVFYHVQNVDKVLDFTNITGFFSNQTRILNLREPGQARRAS